MFLLKNLLHFSIFNISRKRFVFFSFNSINSVKVSFLLFQYYRIFFLLFNLAKKHSFLFLFDDPQLFYYFYKYGAVSRSYFCFFTQVGFLSAYSGRLCSRKLLNSTTFGSFFNLIKYDLGGILIFNSQSSTKFFFSDFRKITVPVFYFGNFQFLHQSLIKWNISYWVNINFCSRRFINQLLKYLILKK